MYWEHIREVMGKTVEMLIIKRIARSDGDTKLYVYPVLPSQT